MQKANGDLNGDGKGDIALAVGRLRISDTCERCAYERLVIVIKGAAKKGYELLAVSPHVIMCSRCGNAGRDPFVCVKIEKNDLIVEQETAGGSSWTCTRTFRYIDKDLYLAHLTHNKWYDHGYCDSLDDNRDMEHTDLDLITGRRYRKTISLNCELIADDVDSVEVRPLIRLERYIGRYFDSRE
ncbi:hypothetical protein GCM10023093_01770 [Nemorincola caseinilytica]|uniref:Uncharacterized protein n=1 Tax=Nemorincola caseinilytica TaxID=2054315 RepID=A0ABP8N1Y7_9BACT